MSLYKLKFSLEDDPFGTDLDRGEDGRGMTRINGAEEATAHMITRARLFAGEVKRDVRAGVQWFGFVDDPRTSPSQIANHIVHVLTGTPGIVDAQTKLEINAIEGELALDVEATYVGEDQRTRIRIHEQFFVRGSGTGASTPGGDV